MLALCFLFVHERVFSLWGRLLVESATATHQYREIAGPAPSNKYSKAKLRSTALLKVVRRHAENHE